MPESQLFRSLPIGSLRYWSQAGTIITTQICEGVNLTVGTTPINFDLNSTGYDFNLQNFKYHLELPQAVEFEFNTDKLNLEGCL